jgi:hypothetical protein
MVFDLNIEPGHVFNVEELAEKYPRQWLAVNVVERDANYQPVKVTVMKRSVNVFDVREGVGTLSFCTLFTGPIPEVAHKGMF